MCNLYSLTKGQAAIIAFTGAMRDTSGNLPALPGIFPDYMASIVRNALDGVRELMMARWGMPSSQKALLDAAKKRAEKIATAVAKALGWCLENPIDRKELLARERAA